ncbi:ABC transporter permease [Thermasporomyces composti]|jgi:ribose transport system permease protein|uniref:Monosaccharide ABC transporter membrane protein (CUT2 family) n=1 Tax=Thermasporomyces composti TaxID=696763 RepID=A0A3D9V843_THECX|nr:ABC transporter permease [Thermasporomyces composti]REF37687.1 monosaccharide ABC transporter membrane protein (CUT2 family) [Thermasporomyces composti]
MTTVAHTLRARRPAARPIEGQELALLGVLVVLWGVLGLATDTFLTGSNVQAILYNVAPIALIGIGMTAVIVTAGIDVSVGSALAVVMVVVAKLIRDVGVPAPLAILVAVALGTCLGAINGALVAFGRIHPIIVTFATLNVFRFVALRIFDGRQVTGVPDTLKSLGGGADGRIWGLPTAWLLAVLLGAAMWWYMRSWPTGRHLYAVGGDARAARLAGVRVRRRLVFAYVLTGALVGLAGCVLIGSGGLVSQNAGEGLELQVIAAVVIGGTSIMGGRGTVLGTMLGALLVGTVTSAVTLLGWPSELTPLFVGVFILVAVGVDLVRARRREAR